MPWGSETWMIERDARLKEWFGGDEDAVAFMLALSDITELWDDLVDKDKSITLARIDKVFYTALFGLAANPFYTKHITYLTPLMVAAINSWKDANVLQTGTMNERAVAYTLRNRDIQIVQAIVLLTQGPDAAQRLGPELWRRFAAEQDDISIWAGGV